MQNLTYNSLVLIHRTLLLYQYEHWSQECPKWIQQVNQYLEISDIPRAVKRTLEKCKKMMEAVETTTKKTDTQTTRCQSTKYQIKRRVQKLWIYKRTTILSAYSAFFLKRYIMSRGTEGNFFYYKSNCIGNRRNAFLHRKAQKRIH